MQTLHTFSICKSKKNMSSPCIFVHFSHTKPLSYNNSTKKSGFFCPIFPLYLFPFPHSYFPTSLQLPFPLHSTATIFIRTTKGFSRTAKVFCPTTKVFGYN